MQKEEVRALTSSSYVARTSQHLFKAPNLKAKSRALPYHNRAIATQEVIERIDQAREGDERWKRSRMMPKRTTWMDPQTGSWHERYSLVRKPLTPIRCRTSGSGVIEPNTCVGETVVKGPRGKLTARILKNSRSGDRAEASLAIGNLIVSRV